MPGRCLGAAVARDVIEDRSHARPSSTPRGRPRPGARALGPATTANRPQIVSVARAGFPLHSAAARLLLVLLLVALCTASDAHPSHTRTRGSGPSPRSVDTGVGVGDEEVTTPTSRRSSICECLCRSLDRDDAWHADAPTRAGDDHASRVSLRAVCLQLRPRGRRHGSPKIARACGRARPHHRRIALPSPGRRERAWRPR